MEKKNHMRKKIIAVIGNANIEGDLKKQKTAFELGQLIINHDFVLATGGLGGVMEYASQGAKSSKNYQGNSILGILPSYDSDDANAYVDIAIPTGLGLARNLVLISTADVVIAVGGGSGTLNEISAAWQMNKLIIGLQVGGWSEKLGNKTLDERRNDVVLPAENPKAALKILQSKIGDYQMKKFAGVKVGRNKNDKAINDKAMEI